MHHGKITKTLAKGLQVLRARIARAKVPSSKLDESINFATWNIREFGRRERREESLHYIAEVLNEFDLVAIVEVRDNIEQLKRVKQYLGPYWDFIDSDYLADAGGNHERIAFLYDKRAVAHTGLASNAFPQRTHDGEEYVTAINWWRPPYLASFCAGSFDFILLSAHIRWGDSDKSRVPELQMLADWVHKRTKEKLLGDQDVIVAGDFNIPCEDSDLFRAITSHGLRMPDGLCGQHGSNLAKNKRYDQILHNPKFTKSFTVRGGVLDFFEGDHHALYPGVKMTQSEFTYEMSDHLPLWIQIATDVEGEELDRMLER